MAPYATSGSNSAVLNPIPPTVLYPGDDVWMLGTAPFTPGLSQAPNDSNVVPEAVIVGKRSIAICLAPRSGGGAPPGLMVQLFASGNPGSAEIDIQDAGIDADAYYITPANATFKISSWTLTGNVYTAWAQLQPESGRFITLKIISNGNAVNFAAKASYI